MRSVPSDSSLTSTGVPAAPCLRAFSIRLRHRMAKASGSMSERAGLGRQLEADGAGRGGSFEIGDHHAENWANVGGRPGSQTPALRAGKLHQLLRKAVQPFQRCLDVLSAPNPIRVGCLGDEPLRLRQSRRNGGAQLVGGIGRKASLGLEGTAQTVEQLVQRAADGFDLVWQITICHRGQVARSPAGKRIAKPEDGAEAQTHQRKDPEKAERNDEN